ncbi:hypothetical protein [Klebsiella phage pKP-BM327-1.1]|nr:hypothetical protein [Klebsiella phage pKP-BM327-1.1]
MLTKIEGSKYNWIDSNDIYVGYDTSTSCCEDAGWYIRDQPTPLKGFGDDLDPALNNHDLTDYKFDVMGESIGIDYQVEAESEVNEGGIVVFRLLHPSKPPLYLHLYNCHNGYYGHEVLTNIPNKSICL